MAWLERAVALKAAEFFRDVADLLDAAEIPFMVAGSFASSYHGDARTTRDLDLVIEIEADGVKRLAAAVDRSRWYLDPVHLLRSAQDRATGNIIDMESGWKA